MRPANSTPSSCAGANDSYSWNSARFTEQYIRDEFNRSLQEDSGNPNVHGTFVQLYINGVYWGLYNPVERPDEEFAATYFGGDAADYDVVHRGGGTFEVQNGDINAWNDMLAKAAQASNSLAAYEELQGQYPDGTPNPATPALLDVASYVRYIAINAWGGNWDWPRNNFFAARDRNPDTTTGFEFFGWDTENTIGNNLSRSPLNADVFDPTKTPGNDFTGSDNAGQPHTSLKTNPEYQLLFADEVQKMFFNGGILTPDSLIARYQALADEVQLAMVGESARWGDMHYPTQPLTPADWVTERDWVLNTYLPQRTAIVLNQFRMYGLYPNVDAPVFNQFGGNYAGGFKLSMTNPNTDGTIYYTLDDSDPRMIGGAVNTAAKTYSGSFLLSGDVTVKARYLSPGGVWSALIDVPFTQNAVGLYPGDFNRDGHLSESDLPAMFSALTDLNAYRSNHSLSPTDLVAIGDLSGDGNVSNRDIQPLLDMLANLSAGGGSSGTGATANAESGSGSSAVVISSSVVPPSAVTETITAPTQSLLASAPSHDDSLMVVQETSAVALSSTSPLLAFAGITVSSSKRIDPSTSNPSPTDSAVHHSQFDDFYRQLSIAARPNADSSHIAGAAADAEPSAENCVDDLLAEILDSQFSLI